jgi:DNA-binding NtrC family response regulator
MNEIVQELSLAVPESGKHKHTVLIVEDQQLVAWDIEQTLRDSGFTDISFATSLSETRALLQSSAETIMLTILDIKLADGDASELIQELIEHKIPVLIITGYSGFSHAHAPVLYKPFTNLAVVEAVRSLLGSDR